MTISELLEIWQVHAPGSWENDNTRALAESGYTTSHDSIAEWYAVSNDDGIVAYFGNEKDAFRFRLAEINRALND